GPTPRRKRLRSVAERISVRPGFDDCVVTVSCRRRHLRCWPARDQAERVVEQRPDWRLARRSMDRLHAFRDPDKIPHRSGWRGRDAFARNAGRLTPRIATQPMPALFLGIIAYFLALDRADIFRGQEF